MSESDTDRAINRAITFLPVDPADDTTRPCLVVAGVQVYAYVRNGELIVSLDFDESEIGRGRFSETPVSIHFSGEEVFASRVTDHE
jgi:hypothetical protein